MTDTALPADTKNVLRYGEDVIETIRANGGGTLIPVSSSYMTPNGVGAYVTQANPNDGYMVSVAEHGWTISDSEDFDMEWLNNYSQRVFEPYRDAHVTSINHVPFLGVWFNPDDSTWYLDVSLYFKDRTDAVHFARIGGELAIWDNANSEAITL